MTAELHGLIQGVFDKVKEENDELFGRENVGENDVLGKEHAESCLKSLEAAMRHAKKMDASRPVGLTT